MLKAAASPGPGRSLVGGPLRAAQSGAPKAHPPQHPATRGSKQPEVCAPSSSPGPPSHAAPHDHLDGSHDPQGSLHSPPWGPRQPTSHACICASSRTAGPTGNGSGHAACLRPAGPHTDLSGVPHAPRLRRPVSCRHPAPATGRPLPVPAGSRARTRQKKPRRGGVAAGRVEGKTTHTRGQETGGRGGRAGGRTESVMDAPGQQRKESVKRGEREGGPPSREAPRLCGVPATGRRVPRSTAWETPTPQEPSGAELHIGKIMAQERQCSPAPSGAISCQEVGRAEEGVATGHRATPGPAGHGACAEHRGPPQSPAWSPRGPRLGLSLPRVTGAGSRGSAGAAAPSFAPRVGKLGLRGAPVTVGQARGTKLPPPHTVPTTSPRTGGHPPGTQPGKWGRQAGWHRASRSKVPKPVPAYLHGQKEILAHRNNLASHSEPRLLQEALHPPCLSPHG